MATTTTPSSHPRRHPPSRPTTPLRPASRTSIRAAQSTPASTAANAQSFPLAALEPAFAELSDAMADLEANMMHLQLLNESLGRFNENFGAFLYGMNMSAFSVDFPEAPIPQSFAQHKGQLDQLQDSPFRQRHSGYDGAGDGPDATFLTTDTSFVENPPTSSKPPSKYSSVPGSAVSSRQSVAPARGGASSRARAAGSGIGRGARGGRGGSVGTAATRSRGRGGRVGG